MPEFYYYFPPLNHKNRELPLSPRFARKMSESTPKNTPKTT